MRVFTAKSLGKSSGSDLVEVIFIDHSFFIFSDPKHIKFTHAPEETVNSSQIICEIHPNQPIFLMDIQLGQLLYWNALDDPKITYRIRCDDHSIIDMKFIPHQTIRLAVLYETSTGTRKVTIYTFDKKLLLLETTTTSAISLPNLEDKTASMIIPLPALINDKPLYIVLGTHLITSVYKNSTQSIIDSPFDSAPTAYCEIAPWVYLISDKSGCLYDLSVGLELSIHKIGQINTIPTSLVKIDGNIFFVGSTKQDSMFIQIVDTKISVLNTIEQFSPVNQVSPYNPITGSVFMTQGQENGSISSLRTGIIFNEEIELSIPCFEYIFGACDKYLILTNSQRSVCLNVTNDSIKEIELNRFLTNEPTISIIPKNENSFIQVCNNTIKSIGDSNQNESINYDSNIIGAYSDGEQILILFNDSAEIVSYQLDSLQTIFFEETSAKTATLSKGMYAFAFWSGKIIIYNKKFKPFYSLSLDNACIHSMYFLKTISSQHLVVLNEDGNIFRYNINDFSLVDHISNDYLIKSTIALDEKSIFINGSNPVIFSNNGLSQSVICPQHDHTCLLGDKIVMLCNNKVHIGVINQSTLVSIDSHHSTAMPFHISIHEDPLIIFTSFKLADRFVLTGFSQPSYKILFNESIDPNEELTCITYHKSSKSTIFGTKGRDEGKLCAIREVLNEIKIIGSITIPNGVVSMYPKNDMLLIGTSTKILTIEIKVSPGGIYSMTTINEISVGIPPRALAYIDKYFIHIGYTRAITVFEEDQENNKLIKKFEHLLPEVFYFGFFGTHLSPKSCHIFTVNDKNELDVFLFKVDNRNNISIKNLTSMKMESKLSSAVLVRNGYAVLSTQDGGMVTLIEYDLEIVKILRNVTTEIAKIYPNIDATSKILQANILELYPVLQNEEQQMIAEAVQQNREELINSIQILSKSISKICSTE